MGGRSGAGGYEFRIQSLYLAHDVLCQGRIVLPSDPSGLEAGLGKGLAPRSVQLAARYQVSLHPVDQFHL